MCVREVVDCGASVSAKYLTTRTRCPRCRWLHRHTNFELCGRKIFIKRSRVKFLNSQKWSKISRYCLFKTGCIFPIFNACQRQSWVQPVRSTFFAVRRKEDGRRGLERLGSEGGGGVSRVSIQTLACLLSFRGMTYEYNRNRLCVYRMHETHCARGGWICCRRYVYPWADIRQYIGTRE